MRYEVRSTEDISKCIRAFSCYYTVLRGYIDGGKLVSSLDRGAFTHPGQVLTKKLRDALGADRHRISFGYGQEAGEQILRERVAELENLKHQTSYSADNVAIVAGAWCGVELVIEELSKLYKGHFRRLKVAVIGPTHYQLFQRPIEMLGTEVTAFDFVNFQGSTPQTEQEIQEILSINPDVVFVTNPNNPIGEYFPTHLLRLLIETCRDREISVVIDEMQNFLPAEGKDLGYNEWIEAKNVIRVDSYSKHFGLAEYRVGWVIADQKYIGNRYEGIIGRIRGLMGNAPRASNDATLQLIDIEIDKIKNGNDALAAKWSSLRRKVEFISNSLSQNPRVKIIPRDACFNLTIKIDGVKNDIEMARRLMDVGTMMMPCEGYGYRSEDVVMRITFAERWRKIRHGIRALKSVIKSFDGDS